MKGSSHTTLTTGNIGIPKFDLTGKIALITGVGSEIGIGRAIARTYARYGADLVIADIDEEKIRERAEEISKESGRRIVPVRCDVCSNEDQENLVKVAMESFGRIDILVNDAGVVLSNDQLIVDTDEDEFDRVVDTDFKAVFFLWQARSKDHDSTGTRQYYQPCISCCSSGIYAHGGLCGSKSRGCSDDPLYGVRVVAFQYPRKLHLPRIH